MELLETTSKKDFYRLTLDHELVVRLYNWITNSQQENERLKKENTILKENAEHNDKVVDKARWNEMIYKSRCENAVEFTKKESKKCYSNQITDNPTKVIGNFMWHTDKLLNILNGGDKE